MDPKAQMPDIKSEVNKVDDGKKKKSGVLGSLFGGGGSGAGGLGGLGAGAAGGGGLLATKAGMLALVLMGSAVAGGIGLAGYKMFGPGDADKTGGNLSLFAPKPQPTEDPNASGAAAGGGDGSSDSLSMMAQSAAKDKEADASADPADKTAADAAAKAAADEAAKKAAADAAAEAAKKAATGPINAGGGAGAVGSFGKGSALGKKFGALSGAIGGGGGSSSSAGMSGKLGDGNSMARNGATSGFTRNGAGSRSTSARGIASARGRSARGDARRVMGDQALGKAGSSFAAGKTYDGSATNAGTAIGPDGGAIGMEGVGDGQGSQQPKAISPNSLKQTNEQEPPEPRAKHMVTPWEAALQRIQLMAIGCLVLGLIAGKLNKMTPYGPIVAKIIGAIMAAMAAYATYLAVKMMTGPNAQVLQGGLALATAAGMGLLAGMALSGAEAFKGGDMSFSNITPLMLMGGGLMAIGLIGGMLAPKGDQVDANDPKYKKGDSDVDGFF